MHPISSAHPDLCSLATELAKIIDAHNSDYPLVSFSNEDGEPDVAWIYAHLVIKVFVISNESASLHSREVGGVSVTVGSYKQAMGLLKQTEAIRQRREHPYFQMF